MRLYGITPRESLFNWPDKSGKDRLVEMTGQWLGTVGGKTKPVFIPVFVDGDEPNEAAWGLVPSETGRPKIVSNACEGPGVIAMVSGFNGDGHEIGRVLIHNDDIENITVVSFGIGGSDALAVRYHEYLLEVTAEARLLIMGTRKPYYYLTLTPESEIIKPSLILPTDLESFTSLDDQSVMTWRKLHARSDR